MRLPVTDRAAKLTPSSVFAVCLDVIQRQARGEDVSNFTAGDFNPAFFRPPQLLVEALHRAIDAGETHYPPLNGLPALREAITRVYREKLGWEVSPEQIVVSAGARPPLYATYRSATEAGGEIVYAAPSWNNQYYITATDAEGVVLQTGPDTWFMPLTESVEPHLSTASVVHLNNPLNPSGTMIPAEELERFTRAVVAENQRREAEGRRGLLMLYDMVYWPLTFRGIEFHHPVTLVPESAPYVVCVDAISKWLTATGLRVGWIVAPRPLVPVYEALFDHMGAWAPRAEQRATAEFLAIPGALDAHLAEFGGEIEARLERGYEIFEAMRQEGLPVGAIRPQGAIYLSVRIDLSGHILPTGSDGGDPEAVRSWLLDRGVALLPFEAFGSIGHDDWFRLSVGGVSLEDIDRAGVRMAEAIREVVNAEG